MGLEWAANEKRDPPIFGMALPGDSVESPPPPANLGSSSPRDPSTQPHLGPPPSMPEARRVCETKTEGEGPSEEATSL